MDDMFEIIGKTKKLKKMYGVEAVAPYYHSTFMVKNINEFIDVIMGLEKILRNDKYSMKKMIYRGMSDESWKLIPSISRNRNLEINENEMIHDFKYRNPDIFLKLSTNFEILAYMQHYGLPTRLLDFTENPLVALYFACKEMNKNNGRILCLFDYIHPCLNKYANILCDIACSISFNEKIDSYTEKYNVSPLQFLQQMYTDYPCILVKPPYWNERQKRQKSVFLIFNSLVSDSYGQAIYYGYDYDIDESVRSSIVDHENFVKIFEDSIWKPDDYFLERYPDKKALSFILDQHSWELMGESYKQEEIIIKEKNFTNRFIIHQQLEKVN